MPVPRMSGILVSIDVTHLADGDLDLDSDDRAGGGSSAGHNDSGKAVFANPRGYQAVKFKLFASATVRPGRPQRGGAGA